MSRQVTPADRTIGENIRHIRLLKNLSQEELANKVNLTFQQIQKYENGINRVSAARLAEFSNILGVPVIDFYVGIISERPSIFAEFGGIASKEDFTVLHAYKAIPRERERRAVRKLMLAISGGDIE